MTLHDITRQQGRIEREKERKVSWEFDVGMVLIRVKKKDRKKMLYENDIQKEEEIKRRNRKGKVVIEGTNVTDSLDFLSPLLCLIAL